MIDESVFTIRPLPPIASHPAAERKTAKGFAPPTRAALGPLTSLPGTWEGTGFNVIWRPNFTPGNPAQDRFLELNLTSEKIEFSESIGDIPNRGLLQKDITMQGLTYMQKVFDSNMQAGLHVEPGIWATVPETENPKEPPTVVRMASIPHGTTLIAQGIAQHIVGAPVIADNDIFPFAIGNPSGKITTFPEQNLSVPSAFRSESAQLAGITQAMVNNPNSVLKSALAGQTIKEFVVLDVSSDPTAPVLGGGVANTAFLQGAPAAGPNAVAAVASSIFWIETVKGQAGAPDFLQLQYTQSVLLNFAGLSWPHVSVATLRKQHVRPHDA